MTKIVIKRDERRNEEVEEFKSYEIICLDALKFEMIMLVHGFCTGSIRYDWINL